LAIVSQLNWNSGRCLSLAFTQSRLVSILRFDQSSCAFAAAPEELLTITRVRILLFEFSDLLIASSRDESSLEQSTSEWILRVSARKVCEADPQNQVDPAIPFVLR